MFLFKKQSNRHRSWRLLFCAMHFVIHEWLWYMVPAAIITHELHSANGMHITGQKCYNRCEMKYRGKYDVTGYAGR